MGWTVDAQKKTKTRLLCVHTPSAASQMHVPPRRLHPPLAPRTLTLTLTLPGSGATFPPPSV